ncbi:MAG: acyltransferase [Butyrivibrio sp.]|nr:acyltransferase [Butyrivibrio sp.]
MNKDNRFIYLFKLIACIFVITIHAPFPGLFGDLVGSISRFAVPFFFAVSGRYLLAGRGYETPKEPAGIRNMVCKRLLRLFRMTLIVYSLHLAFSLWFYLSGGTTLHEWFWDKFNPFEARIFILFNSGRFIYDGSYVFDHMWYLFALIYVYILIIIFAKVLRKWYKGLIVLLLGMLFFGELLQVYYPIRPFDISINTWYVLRNWLFVGMPFVLLGVLFGDYIEKLEGGASDCGAKNKLIRFRPFYIILIIAGCIFSFAESMIFGSKEVYTGSVMIVVGILFLSEVHGPLRTSLWKIGKRSSSNIYFYHVLIIAVLDILSQRGIIPQYTMWQKPLIVIVICLLLFGCIPFLYDRVRGREFV